jgi:CHAT domain-containing protein
MGAENLRHSKLCALDFPTTEFAFLSACHRAELIEESIADETHHLTAATQYYGSRSVVGTIWAMADSDGHDLVEYFYE